MYNCSICKETSEPGEKIRRHTIYRPNKQVERELPVCARCGKALEFAPLGMVAKKYGRLDKRAKLVHWVDVGSAPAPRVQPVETIQEAPKIVPLPAKPVFFRAGKR